MDQLSEEFEEERGKPDIGERIKAARERAGLSLAQVSAETRIAQRHLEMIEAGDFDKLPARTYAVGFSRSVARAIGLDPAEVAADVRAHLDASGYTPPRRISTFEPGDPARIPSAKLGWLMALVAIVLVAAAFIFLRGFLSPAATLPELTADQPGPAAAQATGPVQATPAAAGGPVVFTALEQGVWVKFYDAVGNQLLQKELAKGETYTVPADAQGPMLWTGRPDALAITVGGRGVPSLADAQKIVKDVPVNAAALLARASAAPVQATPTTATRASAAAPARRLAPAPAAAVPAAEPAPAAAVPAPTPEAASPTA